MAYVATNFVFGEQPSAAKWNQLTANDAAFNNGTGIPSANSSSATVTTLEATASTSYTDLSTTGPSVTVTVGSTGMVIIGIGCYTISNTSGAINFYSFVASGANTISAGTSPYNVQYQSFAINAFNESGCSWLITGLNAGSTTFKMQYKTNSGTSNFSNRHIYVVTL